MNDYNVNVIISGPNNEHPATYKTFILRGNTSFADQVTEPNTKYVIKWDFNLNGETVTVPENCILEFDGGILHDGTIVGQDTFINDIGGLGLEKLFAEDIVREGTWRTNGGGNPDKPYDPTVHSGLGRKTLELKEGGSNVLTQEDFSDTNTIYVIQYDFVLGEDVTIPENCVIEFDGGSISGNNTLNLNNCFLNGNISILSEVSGNVYNSEVDVRWFGAVGDGTTDNAPIFQKVFNFVAGKNKIVVLPSSESEYIIGDSVLIRNNTTFKGCGGKIKLKDNYTKTGVTQYVFFNLNQNNVTIDGIEIDGNSANQSESPTVCDLITIVGEHSKVVNCKLYNAPDSGIMFSGVKDGECCNNYIDGAADLCIYVNDGSTDSSNLERCLISKNILKNGLAGGIGLKRTASKTIISENIIESCGNGITLERASTLYDYATNVQIVNNLIRNVDAYADYSSSIGIRIYCSDNVICTGNKLENHKHCGIMLSGSKDCVISNNIITEVSASYEHHDLDAMIYLGDETPIEGGDTFVGKNVIISDNIITAYISRALLAYAFTEGAYLENSIISNNVFYSYHAVSFRGLLKKCVLQGNSFIYSNDTYIMDSGGFDNSNIIGENYYNGTPNLANTNFGKHLGTFAQRPTNPSDGYEYLILEAGRFCPIWYTGYAWIDAAGNIITE